MNELAMKVADDMDKLLVRIGRAKGDKVDADAPRAVRRSATTGIHRPYQLVSSSRTVLVGVGCTY